MNNLQMYIFFIINEAIVKKKKHFFIFYTKEILIIFSRLNSEMKIFDNENFIFKIPNFNGKCFVE